MYKALIVEDDPFLRRKIKKSIPKSFVVYNSCNARSALQAMREKTIDLALIDLNLESKLDGLVVVEEAKKKGIFSVVLSSNESEEIIQQSYSIGADRYFSKDDNSFDMGQILKGFLEKQNKNREKNLDDFFKNEFITNDLETKSEIKGLISTSPDRSILMTGSSGVGKTVLAKFIHDFSARKAGNFINLNCSQFSEGILESEIFGHKKGSFTGAETNKIGKLELANGGTLFLDEVGTMPLNLQTKLLKALDEKSFYPVGSNDECFSNFRLMSATCESLPKLIEEGKFRSDLYFRITGKEIRIKSLSERKEDIFELIKFFLKKKQKIIFYPDAKEKIVSYGWPGNVRQIKKFIDNILDLNKGLIKASDLPFEIRTEKKIFIDPDRGSNLSGEQLIYIEKFGWNHFVDKMKEDAKNYFLKKNNNNVKKMCEELRVSNSWFYREKRRRSYECL